MSGVITVPVSASMYQTMVANIQHLQTNSDGTVCVAPVVQVPKVSKYVRFKFVTLFSIIIYTSVLTYISCQKICVALFGY